MLEIVKKHDENSKNVGLVEDAIFDYIIRGKTLITNLNSELGLDDPESSIVTNPFSVETSSFISNDMSLSGQLSSFLSKGYGFWCSIMNDQYRGQNSHTFVPTTPMMYEFWSHPSVVGNYPNLSTIALHVS